MTFEEYRAIGGQEEEAFFQASIVPAESMIGKIEHEYSAAYYVEDKGRSYALRDMIDSMYLVSYGGGESNILSEKAGSYSVQRRVLSSSEKTAIPYEIVCRYADVRRKAVGVLL